MIILPIHEMCNMVFDFTGKGSKNIAQETALIDVTIDVKKVCPIRPNNYCKNTYPIGLLTVSSNFITLVPHCHLLQDGRTNVCTTVATIFLKVYTHIFATLPFQSMKNVTCT